MEKFKTVLSKPKPQNILSKQPVKYDNAIKLADDVLVVKNMRQFVIVSGNFVFGDFLEAWILKNKYIVKRMVISSLSADQNNIDSLNTLVIKGWVKKLDLIMSTYFYGYQKNNMMRYISEEIDKEKVSISICDTHCKTVLIETKCGLFFTIHGSANLPSSKNIEHFMIEECEEFHKFNLEYQDQIIKCFKLTNKSIRGNKLWQTVITKEKTETSTIERAK